VYENKSLKERTKERKIERKKGANLQRKKGRKKE